MNNLAISSRAIDLTGQRFGKLFVVQYAGQTPGKKSLWLCRCDCGGQTKTQTNRLKSGKTKSCGCLRIECHSGLARASCVFMEDRVILKGGVVCLVDPSDMPAVRQKSWLLQEGKCGVMYSFTNQPRFMFMHNFIMGQKGIDHKNGNGLDNRRSNLRVATRSQNALNCRKPRSSGQRFKGVVPPKNRCKWWRIRLTVDGKQRTYGAFASEIDAARGYDAEARRLYGEFARLNFPEVES